MVLNYALIAQSRHSLLYCVGTVPVGLAWVDCEVGTELFLLFEGRSWLKQRHRTIFSKFVRHCIRRSRMTVAFEVCRSVWYRDRKVSLIEQKTESWLLFDRELNCYLLATSCWSKLDHRLYWTGQLPGGRNAALEYTGIMECMRDYYRLRCFMQISSG